MKDNCDSLDYDVKNLVCLFARYDWDPSGKMPFILSIFNYSKSHMNHFAHNINNCV